MTSPRSVKMVSLMSTVDFRQTTVVSALQIEKVAEIFYFLPQLRQVFYEDSSITILILEA